MQPPTGSSHGEEGGGPPAVGRRENGAEMSSSGTAMLDLDMVEKLKQKYIKCKQQNDRLKEVLLQMQQQGEQRVSAERQGQLTALQWQVEQLQQQLKVREMEQRQHIEELDALQYTNRKQQQQLQQLQQQATAASGGLAGAGGGTRWGIGLLAGAAGGNSAREDSEKRLMEELQVLRDELEHKIRENEQLHVQQFEEKQRQQMQQERLARLDEELQQAHHAYQQLRKEQAETEKRVQTCEALYQEEREEKRQIEERFRELKRETDLQLTRLSEQKDVLQHQQAHLRRYFQRRLPVDLRHFRSLASYDLPCGGATAVIAAHSAAQRQVVSATACLLVRLQQLLAAWSEALCSGSGRTSASHSADLGPRGGGASPPQGKKGDRSLLDDADVSAAGLVAIGKDRDLSQVEALTGGASGGRQHAAASGGSTTAAVSGIHFKLTVANQKALDALLEARKSIDPVKRYLLQKLVAPREPGRAGGAVGLREPARGNRREGGSGGKFDRSPQRELQTGARGCRGLEMEPPGKSDEGVVTALEAQSSLRQLSTAFRRFTSYSLVSLTLETDAFPILDNSESPNANAFGDSTQAFESSRWSARPGSRGGASSSGPRNQTGDARRSTAAFIEASRRFAKCLSLLLEVSQLLFFQPRPPQQGVSASDRLPEAQSQVSPECLPPTSLGDSLEAPHSTRQLLVASPSTQNQAARENAVSAGYLGEGLGALLPSRGPASACEEALARLSSEHFRLLRKAVAPRKSDEVLEEALETHAVEAAGDLGNDEPNGEGSAIPSGSNPSFSSDQSGDTGFRQQHGGLFAAAENSAVARAVAVADLKHDVAKQFLQQVFFRHLEEAMMNMATMEGCISARMCRPHVVEGHMLPLSGGSDAMVDLVQAVKLIDSYIPLPSLLPHLSATGARKTAASEFDSEAASPSHWVDASSELLSVELQKPAQVNEGTTSTVAVLRDGLEVLLSSQLALWSCFLRLPLLDSALHRLQDFMRTRQDELRNAPPRMLRDDALYFREEVQRLTAEEQRLHRQLGSVQLDFDEVLEERDQLLQEKEELRDRYAVMQTRFELARGGFSSRSTPALQRLLRVEDENGVTLTCQADAKQSGDDGAWRCSQEGKQAFASSESGGKHLATENSEGKASATWSSEEKCEDSNCERKSIGNPSAPSAPASAEDSTTCSQNVDAAGAAVAAFEDACAAASMLMVVASECRRFPGSENSLPVLRYPSREAAAAMIEAALLQRGSVFPASSESPVSTAATDAAEAVIATLEACKGRTGEGQSTEVSALEFQQELRRVYVQQVQQLLQHVQTSEDALAALKMQLSSCLKTIHSLDSQRQLLQRQLQEQQSAAAAAASAARLAEVKYMEQLSLLSEHYCQEGEKRKAVEVHMDDMRKQRVLCGRCGVWNSLGFLLGASSGGTCTMCQGRVIEPPA
ncbi:putative trichohyalin [Toxoplasma gondii ARI]|uniref:Putative trichohyalin n=1 Tax=Toxoplasma gondii ARI TaxID=1074872 RepID=A0A139XKH3_TOXGO|nr:putative trichohyalin [Toxoplasma gondii ARI]